MLFHVPDLVYQLDGRDEARRAVWKVDVNSIKERLSLSKVRASCSCQVED